MVALTQAQIDERKRIEEQIAALQAQARTWSENVRGKTVSFEGLITMYAHPEGVAHNPTILENGGLAACLVQPGSLNGYAFWVNPMAQDNPGNWLGIVVALIHYDRPFFPLMQTRDRRMLIDLAAHCSQIGVHTVFYGSDRETVRYPNAGPIQQVNFLPGYECLDTLKADDYGDKSIRRALAFIDPNLSMMDRPRQQPQQQRGGQQQGQPGGGGQQPAGQRGNQRQGGQPGGQRQGGGGNP